MQTPTLLLSPCVFALVAVRLWTVLSICAPALPAASTSSASASINRRANAIVPPALLICFPLLPSALPAELSSALRGFRWVRITGTADKLEYLYPLVVGIGHIDLIVRVDEGSGRQRELSRRPAA